MKNTIKLQFVFFLFFFLAFGLNAQQWQMLKAPLMTSFAAKVDTINVLPEYPRPQMVRKNWMNLNGVWEFQPASSQTEALPTGKLSSKILVPFPVESALSGIMAHNDKLWYRRTFSIPKNWKGQRVLLHFGAVDYETEVFVNGRSVGTHQGGYDPFSFDITSKLIAGKPQVLTVRVYDPTDAATFPRGKQTLTPEGIMYTAVTGIWQTVWLEPVSKTHISSIKMVPNIDNSTLVFKAITEGSLSNNIVEVEVKEGTKTITKYKGDTNEDLVIPVPNPKLWSPDSPFLYDLKVTLKNGANAVDSLSSYFGMRKISMTQVGGFQKMMLNNEFVFQMGPLDQGYWPDGLYTAPTDEALQFDIKTMKEAGFNMVRKHIKVEPYRWYYWADKMGLLVWQDMPSVNSYAKVRPPVDQAAFKTQLEQMIQTHWNQPSIVMWVVFNEGQGQHNTEALVSTVKELDPSRLVSQCSGSNKRVGDLLDIHKYPSPACPVSSTQILACGEYGGVAYSIDNHIYQKAFGHGKVNSGEEWLNSYATFTDNLIGFKTNSGLSAAVYTELTDVEGEMNGFITYDRAVVKVDLNKLSEINQRVIKNKAKIVDILPTSQANAQQWKFTFNQPATDWNTMDYNHIQWQDSVAPFEPATKKNIREIKTNWNTPDIWMRKEFKVGTLSPESLENLIFFINHVDDCEIYINGVLAASLTGITNGYAVLPFSDEAKRTIKQNSNNLIAIHCHNSKGSQIIDAGISIRSYK
jgi:hypothetical protein